MRFLWNEQDENIILPYIEETEAKAESLPKKEKAFFKELMVYFDRYNSYHSKIRPMLKAALADDNAKTIADVFAQNYSAAVTLMLQEEAAYFWDYLKRLPDFPYTRGYSRRTYRSSNPDFHIDNALTILQDWFFFKASGFSVTELALGRQEEQKRLANYIDWQPIFTAHLDRGEIDAVEVVKDAVLGDNQQARLNYPLIKAVLKSQHQELKQLMKDLLLAARLQEGLRQAIVESIDESDGETFRYFFKVIIDEDLLRYSSVKRAVGTWTGLFNEMAVDRMSKKVFEDIQKVLEDKSLVMRWLDSEDNVQVYLALWRLAFDEVEESLKQAELLLEKGVYHKVQMVSYFLFSIQKPSLRNDLSKKVMSRFPNDLKMAACYLPHYLSGMNLSFVNVEQRKEIINSLDKGQFYYHTNASDHKLSDFFADKAEAEAHFQLMKVLLEQMNEKEYTISPCIFPWYEVSLKRGDLAERLAVTATFLGNDYIDLACEYLPKLDTYDRDDFIYGILGKPQTPVQMNALVKALADRSESTRMAAYKVLRLLDMDAEYYGQIEEMLKYKWGDLRQHVITLLLKQDNEALLDSIKRLLTAKGAEKRLGALDMLLQLKNDAARADIYQKALPFVQEIAKPTAKEKILIDQLTGGETTTPDEIVYNRDNGFGLYDKTKETAAEEVMRRCGQSALPVKEEKKSLLGTLKTLVGFDDDGLPKPIFGLSEEEIYAYYVKLDKLVAAHAQDTYKDSWGDDVLLGNDYKPITKHDNRAPIDLDNYPFADIWRDFYQREINDPRAAAMIILLSAFTAKNDRTNYYSQYSAQDEYLRKWFGFDWSGYGEKMNNELQYSYTVRNIMQKLAYCYEPKELLRETAEKLLPVLLKKAQDAKIYAMEQTKILWGKEETKLVLLSETELVRRLFRFLTWNDEAGFRRFFALKYAYFATDCSYTQWRHLTPEYFSLWDLAYAVTLGILDENELYLEMMERQPYQLGSAIRLSGGLAQPDEEGAYPQEARELLEKVTDNCVERILDIELKRGDLPTEVTVFINNLGAIYGVNRLVQILAALGNETLERNYYSSNDSKRSVLSKLLNHTYPAEDETQEDFNQAIKAAKISDKRLVEVAMYASQWLELIEGYLQWQGFASACYYFQAHMNEYSSEKKQAIFAKYTPIAAEDLQLGAFDINWFKEAYQMVGAEHFELIYDAAKYITDGAKHSRARKFADAVNGKLDIEATKAQVMAKRNKDLLLAYSLIPLDKKQKNDLLNRYQYLQQFQKESRQFGAQRRASEGKTVEIAMENLARNAGYADVTRLTWQMETALIKTMASYFEPKTIEGYQVYVDINQLGQAAVVYEKDGKPLKSQPAKLKKNSYIEELKQVHQQLKAQYSRSKMMLEEAMADGTQFLAEELNGLLTNPVIAPLLKNLVFMHDDFCGYFSKNQLTNVKGEEHKLTAKGKLKLAHPYDLYRLGLWADFQKDLFDRKIVQPFKQVFRELYLKTVDEKGQYKSLRYAGNQIQPKKAAALLKTRRWVADYENGLQKIYYQENIIAEIYALADWFSPADIEAPTLEWVAFSDRKTFKPKLIDDIPDVLFSEIMRDVDLAVSVAHAGGVDPETSHSTIEMRQAIVAFTLPLFKLTNVSFNGSFAVIDGTLGKYNVHLGSGVVHQEAKGSLNILPVHSQHRGKLFLPFVDEDPKTAEILSKILLLAEDNKIKDPFILEQIQ